MKGLGTFYNSVFRPPLFSIAICSVKTSGTQLLTSQQDAGQEYRSSQGRACASAIALERSARHPKVDGGDWKGVLIEGIRGSRSED